MYSPFLDEHFNIIKGFTNFLTGAARVFVEAFGYTVSQNNYHTLRIEYSPGINVNPSCLGWGVMSFWIAFIYANTGRWKHKLKWLTIGILSICALNIARIALITLAAHLHWKTITSLDHHQVFNILSYGCIFILMYVYIRHQKKYETGEFKETQEKKRLGAA